MQVRILVTGANRGLGLEFVRQYLTQGARVFAAARNPTNDELALLAVQYPEQLSLLTLDVTEELSLRSAHASVQKQTDALDVLINNAGINPRGKGLGHYKRTEMLEVLHTNAVAPVLVGQTFLPLLRRGNNPKLINISTQMGSFSWNQTGSSPLYAASKAALNMYTRSFAHEAKDIITVAVHPGWVQTDMGGASAPLTPTQAVQQMRALIERLTPADNGHFFTYDGRPHPW